MTPARKSTKDTETDETDETEPAKDAPGEQSWADFVNREPEGE
ncbi:MAG TPA: hypothetical protein VKB57_27030 [Acidimicrobiales bacterium]|nr:hypothetical protein [Acidimicrobiales bacterium]